MRDQCRHAPSAVPAGPPLLWKADAPSGQVLPVAHEGEPADGRVLVCAACATAITSEAARSLVGGVHEHFHVNPEGHGFHIGCFADATNVVTHGGATAFWSWFPGYTWQIELCLRCGTHLGWLFRSPDDHFHGFVLDRLAEQQPDA